MENIILTNNKDLRLVSVKVGVLSTLRFELPLVSASATHVEVIVTSGNVHSAYTATFIDNTKCWQCDIAASQFPAVGKQSYEIAYVLDGKQFWDGKGWIEIEDATTSGIEPQPRPEPYRYAVVSVNGYGADAQGAVRIPKTFIATNSPVTTEGYMEGDIYFNRETGAMWTLCDVQGTLTWVFNYQNYYTKTETDALVTLTPIYSQTPTFSEWTFAGLPAGVSNPVLYYNEGGSHWEFGATLTDATYGERSIYDDDIAGEADATSVAINSYDGPSGEAITGTATRMRTDIIGYRLGPDSESNPNRNKPLASEAEAEALRTAVAAKYAKPSGGIPKSDLASGVQASLNKADAAFPESDATVALSQKQDRYTAWTVTMTPPSGYEMEAIGQPYYDSNENDWLQQFKFREVGETDWSESSDTATGALDAIGLTSSVFTATRSVIIDGKANRAANPTAGNLAALDAQGNPTDAGVKASAKLDSTSAAPAFSTSSTYAVGEHCTYNGGLYRCTTAVTTAGAWDASKWTADMASNYFQYALVTKTIANGAVTLDDRAINAVAVSSSLASLTVNFPTATSGKARDFGLRLTVASGITTAPELALPQGVVCENADGEAPEIGADGAATILYFTETASGVFLVKGEVVTAIS